MSLWLQAATEALYGGDYDRFREHILPRAPFAVPGGWMRASVDLYAARVTNAGGSAMIEDEVVREVRAAREAFAASHGFDIRKMVAALHDLGVASGRELVRFAPRPAIIRPNQSLEAAPAAEL